MEPERIEIYAMNYETFLNSAFRHDKRIKKASKQELLNLISIENGRSNRFIGSIDKQLDEIKGRIFKAIKMLLLLEYDDSTKSELLDLLNCVDTLYNSQSIILLIEKGLILIRPSR